MFFCFLGAVEGQSEEELKAYLEARDGKLLDKFDVDLFRKLVE